MQVWWGRSCIPGIADKTERISYLYLLAAADCLTVQVSEVDI
jgi:hypothetical protein